MLTLGCSSCQKKLSVAEEHAGKKIKCPACGAVSVAPAPPPPAAIMLPTLDETHAKQGGTSPFHIGAQRGQHDSVLVDFLAPAQNPDEIGRLGKYRILGILGHGGMGVVYQAEDVMLTRTVALKAILPSLGAGDPVRKRFLREARTMAQLEHEHVVRLYEVNEAQGVPYIAMELLAGEPLDLRLCNEAVLPLAETLRIGREIAQGLAAAHARDLIHRDIKPANIFLAGDARRVKILDFGLARAQEEDSPITQSGAILGTPSYMAPEQTRGEKVDFRADLFSLGVVLYRMSTGADPFTAKDPLTTMVAVATQTPPTPQMQNFDVPSDLSDLIMQLLEKNPAKRGTAQEVVAALTRIEKGEPAPAPKPQGVDDAEDRQTTAPNQSRAKLKRGGFPWLIVVAAVAVAFICIAVPLIGAALYLFR